MEGLQPLKRPFLFLSVFCLVACLLLPVWTWLSKYYLAALLALVDVAAQCAGVSAQIQLQPLAGDDVFTPSIVAGVALFIATPDRSCHWKLRWIVRLAVLFAIGHAVLLFVQVQIAFAHTMGPARPAHGLVLQRLLLPLLQGTFLQRLVDTCYCWIYPVLDTLVWFAAVQSHEGVAQSTQVSHARQ